MGGAARRLLRVLAFGALRILRILERASRTLAYASFSKAELSDLSVAEWEAFGLRPPVRDDRLFAWEEEWFARHIRPGDALLVIGAGTGRDVIPLLEAGHSVTALDPAPGALAVLERRVTERGRTVSTIQASVIDCSLPPGAFDVVLFSWFTFNYLSPSEARRSAILKSEAALRPGGRILISYPVRTASGRPQPFYLGLGRLAARLIGGVEPEPGDEIQITGTSARPGVHLSHPFTSAEIDDELRQTGLAVVSHTQVEPGVGLVVLVRP